ncbi:MrcB family domain-containing protein [Roseomonas xinghualingensis]|uniref:MrcB family domain-containing protein n=1 Tax=Roseomonas xinghualingensis TaxID=2986475 RepID=UPI00366DCB68
MESGRSPNEYRCYGGYGEPNRTFAKVPWVAVCATSVTRTVTKGYYIVLLFRADMRGCWLSLNQGYTQYSRAFGSQRAAHRHASLGAQVIFPWIDIPEGFVAGPLDLAASTDLGKGYEAGAIVSKYYDAVGVTSEADVAADFRSLLKIYDQLRLRLGASIVDLLPDDEVAYQNAAAELVRSPPNLPDLSPGPQPRPKQNAARRGAGHRRDPAIAFRALRMAEYNCELGPTHSTFTARRTRKNFVEAHHLVPMSEQHSFENSLDVPENVVALCPNCHRLLHHGLAADRISAAVRLFRARSEGLSARGIVIAEADIRSKYKHQIEDDFGG